MQSQWPYEKHMDMGPYNGVELGQGVGTNQQCQMLLKSERARPRPSLGVLILHCCFRLLAVSHSITP